MFLGNSTSVSRLINYVKFMIRRYCCVFMSCINKEILVPHKSHNDGGCHISNLKNVQKSGRFLDLLASKLN